MFNADSDTAVSPSGTGDTNTEDPRCSTAEVAHAHELTTHLQISLTGLGTEEAEGVVADCITSPQKDVMPGSQVGFHPTVITTPEEGERRRFKRYEGARGSMHPALVVPTPEEWESGLEAILGSQKITPPPAKPFTFILTMGRHQRFEGMNDDADKVEEDATLSKLGMYLAEEDAWQTFCKTLCGESQVPDLAVNSILLRAEQTMDPFVLVWEHLTGKKQPRLGIAQFREDVFSRSCSYVRSKHPKAGYPNWFGSLSPTDDSAWTEGKKEEDMRERARQCWQTLLRLASETYTRRGKEGVTIDLRAHIGINRAISDVAIGEKLAFEPGDQVTLEVIVSGDGSCTCRKVAFDKAPVRSLDETRRPFTQRLTSLPSQLEWDAHLSYLGREMSSDQKTELARAIVDASNDPEMTKGEGWWKSTVERGVARLFDNVSLPGGGSTGQVTERAGGKEQ